MRETNNRPGKISSEGVDSRIDIQHIREILFRGKWIILFTILLVVGAMAVYTKMSRPIYSAFSLVLVESLQPQSAIVPMMEQRKLASEVGILQNSVELAMQVGERLTETAAAIGDPEQFPSLRNEEGQVLSLQKVAERLLARRVTFVAITAQDMIRFVAESTSAEEAATIANLYVEEYKKYSREQSRASLSAQSAFLKEQVEMRKLELEQLEAEWVITAINQGIYDQEKGAEFLLAEFNTFTTKRTETQFELEGERHELDLLQRQLSQREPELLANVLQENEASQIKGEIEELDKKIAEFKVQALALYAKNPGLEGDDVRIASEFKDLADVNEQIKVFTRAKLERVNRYYEERQNKISDPQQGGELSQIVELREKILEKELTIGGLRAELTAISKYIDSYRSRLESLPRQSVENEQFDRKRTLLAQQYIQFVEELQKAQVAEEAELGYIRIVRSAVVPRKPARPNVQQNLMLATLVGLALGIGLAFLRGAMDSRVSSPEDLSGSVYPTIGIIPNLYHQVKSIFGKEDYTLVDGTMMSTRLIAYHDSWSPTSEGFRLISLNLPRSRAQVLLVTSPEPSDGKSLTAANLAITKANGGATTLLVDADMRHPSAHTLLGSSLGPGLADVLTNGIASEAAVRTTPIDRLSFLPAGRINKPPPEMLGSTVMREFVRDLRARFDVIILDSPPVLAATDALVLARHADATIVVVSSGKTTRRALEITQAQLDAETVSVAGIVLNRFESSLNKGYGYGYGYPQYGNGAAKDTEEGAELVSGA